MVRAVEELLVVVGVAGQGDAGIIVLVGFSSGGCGMVALALLGTSSIIMRSSVWRSLERWVLISIR